MNVELGGDYVCAKLILEISTVIYTKNSNERLFVKDAIRDHSAWKTLNFWKEYFWDTTAQKLPGKDNPELEINKSQKEVLNKILRLFLIKMTDWGNFTSDEIRQFLQSTLPSLGLSIEEDQERLILLINKRQERRLTKRRKSTRSKSNTSIPRSRSTETLKSKNLTHRPVSPVNLTARTSRLHSPDKDSGDSNNPSPRTFQSEKRTLSTITQKPRKLSVVRNLLIPSKVVKGSSSDLEDDIERVIHSARTEKERKKKVKKNTTLL